MNTDEYSRKKRGSRAPCIFPSASVFICVHPWFQFPSLRFRISAGRLIFLRAFLAREELIHSHDDLVAGGIVVGFTGGAGIAAGGDPGGVFAPGHPDRRAPGQSAGALGQARPGGHWRQESRLPLAGAARHCVRRHPGGLQSRGVCRAPEDGAVLQVQGWGLETNAVAADEFASWAVPGPGEWRGLPGLDHVCHLRLELLDGAGGFGRRRSPLVEDSQPAGPGSPEHRHGQGGEGDRSDARGLLQGGGSCRSGVPTCCSWRAG